MNERPFTNLYREGPEEVVTVFYPDGPVRFVATKKVRDTAGTEFCVFADNTPISIT